MDIPIEEIEEKWKNKWRDMNLYRFEKSDKPVFTMDVPPPTISGNLHMGHAFSYPHQDFVARYKRMKGFNVCYQFGFDDNGLPTEKYVEKSTGKKGKNTPLVEYLELCRQKSTEAEGVMAETLQRLGISADFSRFYRTSSEESVKISQKAFLDLAGKDRAYNAIGPTIKCPTCGTAISQIELKDRNFRTDFVHIRFGDRENPLIIATTRPEMLAACVAIFVNPSDLRYSGLIGTEITVPLYGFKVKVMADEYVSVDVGTGAEMVCTFGDQNDMYLWKKHSLETRMIISEDGTINDQDGPLQGMPINRARKEIIKRLTDNGFVERIEKMEHSVNVHERCDTPVEIGIERQWFIRVLDIVPGLIENGNRIAWIPEHMKVRYENWVNGLKWDWCVSRQRYFGVPFPVWRCNDCDSLIFADESELPVDPRLNPGRKCEKCGSDNTSPETDVMDTWATSSLSPKISLSMNSLMETGYPMDIRFQGHDIISTWAFTTVTRALLHDGSIPWKNILLSGIVSDPTGAKMSKSKGNVTNPVEVLEAYGGDAIRFWAGSSLAWDDIRFKEQELVRGRRTLVKLYNAAKLLNMLASDTGITDIAMSAESRYSRWILRKLSLLEERVDSLMSQYLFSKARTEIDTFFWNVFCDHYLEISKFASRNGSPESRDITEAGLYTLLQVLKLYSPLIPFATEEIYSNLPLKGRKESIHLEPWPEKIDASSFSAAEAEIDYVIEAVSAIRSEKAKKGAGRKRKMSVVLSGSTHVLNQHRELIESLSGIELAGVDESQEFAIKAVNG